MIHIQRTYPAPESILNDSAKEHQDAHAHYQISVETFNHKVFARRDVKLALETLFNGKCAYCEAKVVVTSPIDKEHFRPKGAIKDENLGIHIKPGYYWLAADWENLLLACANCNRTGRHENTRGDEFVSGKLDRFPLANEVYRYKYGGNFNAEERVRLLINPCIEDPEEMIDYEEDGAIKPKQGISAHRRNMADTSIKTFGLMRSDLVKARHEKSLDILDVIVDIKIYLSKYKENSKVEYLAMLKRKFHRLEQLINDSREYLGIARTIVRRELNNLKEIAQLVSNN